MVRWPTAGRPRPNCAGSRARAAPGSLQAALDAAWAGVPDGLSVRAIIARGEPGPALVDEAEPEDLLVLGAGRRGLRSRLVSGRVTR